MIGIFCGTFDPPHLGHKQLALSLAEAHGLEEVWWVPAFDHPFKREAVTTSFADRCAMVEKTISDLPHHHLVDIEKTLPKPSYTANTLGALREKEGRPFALLLGKDAADSLPLWHAPEKILELATVLVAERTFPISATTIRKKLRQGEDCRGWLVPDVVDYIESKNLYR